MNPKILFRCIAAFLLLTMHTSCLANDNNTPKQPTTDVITYSIVPQDKARALFVNEPLHNQVTPIFVDITLMKRGSTYSEWLEVAKSSILPSEPSKQHFLDSIAEIQTQTLKTLGIKLPIDRETEYIDMTMRAFNGAAAFTSATRIYAYIDYLRVISQKVPRLVQEIAWHEIWHVISRNNPELRKKMYELIGFKILPEEIDIPQEVRAHILCNPDVERHDSYATFTIDGKPTDCLLLLYTAATEYIDGTSLSNYLSGNDGYWLLALDKVTHQPYRNPDGKWAIYKCTEATDFDQVMSNGNTSYCDDPEECMADNFALAMVSDQSAPNQKLLEDIRSLLKAWTR